MYVVINGAGKVGFQLAEILAASRATVAVIEKRLTVCEELTEQIDDILVIHGDGADVRYLEDAGIARADVFAAVTGDDDDNLVACQLAKVSFDVPRTVARINNPKNEHIFHELGIEGISSTTVIAQLIQEEATVGDILTLRTIRQGEFAVVEMSIPVGSVSVRRTISELNLPEKSSIVTIIRGDEAIVPKGATEIQEGDLVICLTAVAQEAELQTALTGRP